MLQQKLGRKSARTYFYGFSAGAFLGRMVHYAPGLNRGDDGRPLFDAFLLDARRRDVAADAQGRRARTPLFVGDDKQRASAQIDLTHQLYTGDSTIS